MEKFASTGKLMELLGNGKYKRLVMENEEGTLNSGKDFEVAFEDYKAFTSRPTNYDYFTRRQQLKKANV